MKITKIESGAYKAGKLVAVHDKDVHGRYFYEVSHPDRMPRIEEIEELIKEAYGYEGKLVAILDTEADEYIGYDAYDSLPYAIRLYEVCDDGAACPVCGKE
ncbi:hypothetical protein [Mahella australiensis]|uniref:Uncharacterized protein n=1 Tax=Mahella australiensis (strain DSM 15567 / CIP 107919 / 50-1 BON) TaxID=697281 RepID=F3ZZE7_MAHA5|nr:hypothetical protein [Mahella australiensis]AEE95757.1 hypothetical protein Mahau_0553 [Mahella australiensis 50-1 BON]